jgi:hypothetical protein
VRHPCWAGACALAHADNPFLSLSLEFASGVLLATIAFEMILARWNSARC